MSVKKTMDKTMAALENTKSKICSVYEFVNGLSLRNKANFDLSVKSKKTKFPMWKFCFGYNKEIRVMPVVLCSLAVIFAVGTIMCIVNDDE